MVVYRKNQVIKNASVFDDDVALVIADTGHIEITKSCTVTLPAKAAATAGEYMISISKVDDLSELPDDFKVTVTPVAADKLFWAPEGVSLANTGAGKGLVFDVTKHRVEVGDFIYVKVINGTWYVVDWQVEDLDRVA